MTLREYFINKSKGKCKLMERDDYFLYAESWDAEEFAKQALGMELKKCKYKEVLEVFLDICRNFDLANEELKRNHYDPTDCFYDEDDTVTFIPGGSKKLNLMYDPITYERFNPNED